MEQELDLRPYLQAVLRGWRLILAVVTVFALLAAIVTVLQPRSAQARGDLLVIPQTTQLTLDSRFADRDATMVTNALNQRQALVDLASSSVLELRVAQELGLDAFEPGELVGSVEVSARSDLIQIVASEATPEEALRLAETWTRSYESLVNELYSGAGAPSTQLAAQIADAQQRFEGIQGELEAFYTSGELVRSEQQILRLKGLLDGGSSAQVRLYTEYLTRTQELNLILEDARTLQAQAAESSTADLSAALAALALRARVAGGAELPVQLNFADAESFAQSQAAAVDLGRFAQVLAGERDRMVAQADALARDLAAGNTAAVGLPADVRARYEAELAAAMGALALAQGQEALLLQRRNIALRALEVLQAKGDEGQISQALPEISVRYVGVASVPPRSLVVGLIVNVFAAVLLGLFVATAWVLGRYLLQRRAPPAASARPAPPQGERSADRPVASD